MRILAIGAHPDDIEFGCGGTLLKYARQKHKIYLLVLTEGRVGGYSQVRKREQEKAAKFLSAKKIFWGNFEDTQVPASKELIDKIEGVINRLKPDIVFFNFYDDIHQDHRAVANCSSSATRYIKKVLFYEVPTTRNFQPDVFVDITDILSRKLELLKIHSSQVRKTHIPHLTILEAAKSCANFRGFQAKIKYAEGFEALRLLMETK